ncbi:MAG: hypothetical protein JWR42_2682 [Marmoricola sp.]|nr:hypothetical protein [Marmoricola sp.]
MSRLRARVGRVRRAVSYDAPGAVAEIVRRLDRQHDRLAALERDLARIGPQVAGLEARLEDLREAREVPPADGQELADARSLVEEVRREHERTRARISAAARFEERLEQVEELLAALPRSTP